MKSKQYSIPEIRNFPENLNGHSRRTFLRRMTAGMAAAAWGSSNLLTGGTKSLAAVSEIPGLAGEKPGDEAYWSLVKDQFMIRKGLIMLNAANLCPSPFPVQHTVFNFTRDIDQDPSSINREKFSELRERSRKLLAGFVGADPDEIAIVRNTSEANNIVIGGLSFKRGDEVLIWDENHPTANVAWDVRAERYGFTVKRIKMPPQIRNAEDMIRPFEQAMTHSTRLICFSHVSNLSGIALPVKKLCRIARERNILSHIDGAQTFGSQVINLHSIGCDFYSGSSHKWFCGPKEVGILYVKKENIKKLWPAIIGVGYPGALKKGAQKFETLGQRDDARIAAMAKTVEFHQAIGCLRIEKRIKDLASRLKNRLRERIPDIKFRTPESPDFSGGVVVFKPPGVDMDQALNRLYSRFNIGAAVFGGELAGIRMCPHIYNTTAEVDAAAAAAAELIK